MLPKAYERIRTHLNRSEWLRLGPERSNHVQKLPNFRQKIENKNRKAGRTQGDADLGTKNENCPIETLPEAYERI